MDQSVMTFAGTAARGSAIGTATEGMLTYLNDTDTYQSWNGSAWTGLVPQSPNAVINGAFDFWQRGTTFSNPASEVYLADRWRVAYNGTTGTRSVTRETFTPGTAPVSGYEGQYFLRYAQTVAGTGGTFNVITQKIEDVRTFANQTVTVSFWAKAGAALTGDISLNHLFGSGGSPSIFGIGAQSLSVTTSWARYSFTINVPSVSGKTIGPNSAFEIVFGTPVNTIFTLDIWGVQLEAGSTATPFRRNGNNIQAELAACQRYYFRQSGTGNLLGPTGVAYSTSAAIIPYNLPVEMRVPPSAVEFSNVAVNDGITSRNMPNVTVFGGNNDTTAGLNLFGGTGLTQFRPYFLETQSGLTGFIAFSAEL
jgi:hypothetical protein